MLHETSFIWMLRVVFLIVLVPYLVFVFLSSHTALTTTYDVSKAVWGPVGTAATVTYLYYLIFKKWLWRWSLFQGWLVRFPDLTGTWLAEAVSETFNQAVHRSVVTIDHKFDRLTYRGWRRSSVVNSDTCVLDIVDQETRLFVIYGNRTGRHKTEHSVNHDGCIKLVLQPANENQSQKLEGEYWTNKLKPNGERGTVGHIEMFRKCRDLLGGETKIAKEHLDLDAPP